MTNVMVRNRLKNLSFILIAFFYSSYTGYGQVLNIVNFIGFEEIREKPEVNKCVKCMADNCAADVELLLRKYADQGYFMAEYEVNVIEDTFNITFKSGQRFYWKDIQFENVPPHIINQYSSDLTTGQPFSQRILDDFYRKIVLFYENEGYPFASVRLQNIHTSVGHISASVKTELGPEISYGSINIIKGLKLKELWLGKVLEIEKGMHFRQNTVNEIENNLERLGISLSSPVEINFSDDQANISLNIDSHPVSSFDGILGMFMNGNSQDAILAGYLDLSLGNLFSSWKSLDLSWRRLRPLVQELTIRYDHPVFFSRLLNAEAGFQLMKSDTSFLNIQGGIELQLQVNSHLIAFISEDFERGSLLAFPVENVSETSGNGDYKISYHGIGLKKMTGPMRMELKGSIGNKNILANPTLPTGYYDNMELNSLQGKFSFLGSYRMDLYKNWKVYNQLSAGLLAGNSLLNNDAFRLGGLKTFRGYNEYQFMASKFTRATVELRYYLEKSGYLLFFSDFGYLQYNILKNNFSTTPVGTGTGISIKVGKEGHFDLIFAIDKESVKKVDFTNSKIHFGYLINF